MDVKIIGDGTVGTALATNLGLTPLGLGQSPVEGEVIVICVPTETVDGQQDLAQVKQALSRIERATLVILRSTVLPGTTDELQQTLPFPLMFVPEFGNEDTMVEDLKNPPFYVLGLTLMSRHLAALATQALPPGDNYLPIRAIAAEFTKYYVNLWGATQVTMANVLYDWTTAVTDDASIYEEAVFAAKNFHSFPQWGWKVSDKGGRGAGGKCLPKDLKAALSMLTLGSKSQRFFSAIDDINDEYRLETGKK